MLRLTFISKNSESAPYKAQNPSRQWRPEPAHFPAQGGVYEDNDGQRMRSTCGILPLMILPVLPDTWILAVLFCLACLLCLIPHHMRATRHLTLTLFMWGYLPRRATFGRGNVLPAARRRQSSLLPPII
ncbi:hypothetical protein KCP76_19255 [Salmonella enterica subsp. enterica serovar Weltevreden]|nr:hypothetical protein KCP76_19255 [Salmonella enterica subsp. enterica serovar Weltevreden]